MRLCLVRHIVIIVLAAGIVTGCRLTGPASMDRGSATGLAEPEPGPSASLPTIAPPVTSVPPSPTGTPPGPLALPSPRPTRQTSGVDSAWASIGASNRVNALVTSVDGSLWAATAVGITRWDTTHGDTQSFGSPSGLASQHVSALLVSSDGALWAGTDAGLSRYDGASWVTYTRDSGLPADIVTLLAQGSDGTLWCGTVGGLARWRDDRWEAVWEPQPERETVFADVLESRNGDVWFAIVGAGILRADAAGRVSAVENSPENVTAMAEDAAGSIWAADRDGTLWQYDGSWAASATPELGAPVVSLEVSSEGDLWVASANAIARLRQGQWTLYTASDGPAVAPYNDLTVGYDGHVYCAGAGGLARHAGAGWENLWPDASQPGAEVYRLLADQTMGLFAATSQGIVQVAEGQRATYRSPLPETDGITSLVEAPDGSIWLRRRDGAVLRHWGGAWSVVADEATHAVSGGIERLFAPGDATIWASGKGATMQLDPTSGAVLYESRCLAEAQQRPLGLATDGSVWLGSARGLTIVSPEGDWLQLTEPEALPPADPATLMQSTDGLLWLGTAEGLYTSGWSEGQPSWRRVSGLRAQSVRAVEEGGDGRYWVAFPTGLAELSEGTWQVHTVADGLPGNDVRALLVTSSGELWVGTAAGLARLNGDTWERLGTGEDLPDQRVTALAEALDGGIWVGTEGGLARYGSDAWTTVAADPIRAASAARDGSLWFGTDSGVRRYDAYGGYELDDGDLSEGTIDALLADAGGTLWAATPDGMARMQEGYWITPEGCGPGAGQTLSMIRDSQGALWVLTDLGVYRHAAGRWARLAGAAEQAPGSARELLVAGPGLVWHLTEQALAAYDSASWTSVDLGAAQGASLLRLAREESGSLWLATDRGLYFKSGEAWQAVPDLADQSIDHLLVLADGEIWAASDTVIAHRTGTGWQLSVAGDELPQAPISCLYPASDGTLWAVTAGAGLLHHNEKGWSLYNSLHGLAHDDVLQILEDRDGALWILTSHGISRYTPAP